MIKVNEQSTAKQSLSITLAELPLQKLAIIQSINAGKKASQRLSGMGLTPGTKIIKLTSAPFHGPIQIKVRDTRLALGQGLAHKILVQMES